MEVTEVIAGEKTDRRDCSNRRRGEGERQEERGGEAGDVGGGDITRGAIKQIESQAKRDERKEKEVV